MAVGGRERAGVDAEDGEEQARVPIKGEKETEMTEDEELQNIRSALTSVINAVRALSEMIPREGAAPPIGLSAVRTALDEARELLRKPKEGGPT